MFLKNKKGLDYAVLFAIVVVPLALLLLFFQIQNAVGGNKGIGLSELKLLEAGQKSEEILFYVDASARNALDTSLFELYGKGGFLDKSECGVYNDYNVWQTKYKSCYPEIKIDTFFLKELNDYLALYPDGIFKKDNYFATIKDKKLIGQPLSDIILDVNSNNKVIGNYLFTPSFTIEIGDDFSKATENARKIFGKCFGAEKIKECVEAQIILLGLTSWESVFENNFAVFDVDTGKSVLNNKKKNNMIIKFALDLSQ